VSLPAHTPREVAVVQWLQQRFGHASAERVISGPGLQNLHNALCGLDGLPAPSLEPARIAELGLAQQDAHCVEAVQLFYAWLGSLAGNLALILGATGGVYLGGGILPRWGLAALEASAFRERFEGKGRYRAMLAPIPVWMIDAAESPALLGAARHLDDAVAHSPLATTAPAALAG
jgi:glucokinase